jgi:DNA invertase Pin-like site-specific DNA recombinase
VAKPVQKPHPPIIVGGAFRFAARRAIRYGDVIGAIACFERELMLERQREGIAKAKVEGKYKGRKPTARARAAEVEALKADGVRPTDIALRLGIGRA